MDEPIEVIFEPDDLVLAFETDTDVVYEPDLLVMVFEELKD